MPVITSVPDEATMGCDAVVEALIREHLTKKQYNTTLAAFKQEEVTIKQLINKRSTLQELLGLRTQAADSSGTAGSLQRPNSSSSTLEWLVQEQLQHHAHNRATGSTVGTETGAFCTKNAGSIPAAGPRTCSTPAACGQDSSQQPEMHVRQQASQQQQTTFQRRLPAMNMPQPPQQQQHKSPADPHNLLHRPNPQAQRSQLSSTHQQRMQQQQHPESSVSKDSDKPDDSRSTAALSGQVEDLVICDVELDEDSSHLHQQHLHPLPPAAAVPGATLSRRLGTPTTTMRPAGSWSAGSSGSSVGQGDPQPLPPEQQRRLAELMWGGASAQPEAAWQQGFMWCGALELEWGLLQVSGGPCGVLAAVQAHLIATLMQQQLWHPLTPPATAASTSSSGGGSSMGQPLTQHQLHEALITSLSLMLWGCACSSSSSSSSSSRRVSAQVATIPRSGSSSAGLRGLCDAGQVLRMVAVSTAHSLQELQVLVRAALPQWCQPKQWGVLLLVYSAVLSRGCDGVASDMDNEARLVDALGYCSMELVNLLLTGAAVSNVFDGCQTFGDVSGAAAGPAAAAGSNEQLVIKGVQHQARVGLLTLLEWYRYVEVGHNLKRPRLPVWVVCSESHFSVLALSHFLGQAGSWDQGVTSTQQQQQQQQQQVTVDTAGLRPSAGAPLVLQYYDGLAKQEGPIQLVLLPAQPGQGWSSRLEGVAEERGVWQGRPIPPLECVVETKWRDTAVAWHGSEPIF